MADTDAEKMANKLSEEDHEDIVKFGSLVGFTELIFHILQVPPTTTIKILHSSIPHVVAAFL